MPDLYVQLSNALRGLRLNRVAARLIPDTPITRAVPHIGRFTFSLRRHRWLLGKTPFRGHAPVLGLFHHLVRPGDTLYDIGANIGYYARYNLAHLDLSHLVAFEPFAPNRRLLEKNLADEPRARVIGDAVGDVTEDGVELQVDDMAGGSSVLTKVSGGEASLGRASAGLAAKADTVRLVTLDDLRREDPTLPGPDVMKIDTEGAEHLVLAGAEQTLAEHKPRLILASHGTDRAALMLEQLQRLGYHLAGWDNTGTWRVMTTAEQMGNNNCIASVEASDIEREPAHAEVMS
ncbi:MAG: FkbM family methyltransferase [Planctomycetota bacterium]